MSRRLLLSLCVVVPACGSARSEAPAARSAPAASDPVRAAFAARAPAATRVLGAVDLAEAPELLRDVVAGATGEMHGTGCSDNLTKVTRVRAALGPGVGLVEIDGALRIVDVACGFGVPAPSEGRLVLGDLVATDTDTGVRISGADPFAAGASAALRRRFEALPASAMVAVADLGNAAVPVQVDLVARIESMQLRLAVDDAGKASRLLAQTTAVIDGVRGLHPSGTFQVRDERGAVVIDVRLEGVSDGAVDAMAIRTQLVEAFRVPSASMWPTLEIGDHVIALKGALAGPIERGDVVVVRHDGKSFIKRVVGVAGDRLRFEPGRVLVNGAALPRDAAVASRYFDQFEPGTWEEVKAPVTHEAAGQRRYSVAANDDSMPAVDHVVAIDSLFVVGDNRGNSSDSRAWGTVPRTDIVGRAVVVWYSDGPSGVRWDRLLTAID